MVLAMSRPTQNRNGTFYLVRRVPKALQSRVGRAVVKLSLRTKDRGEATKRFVTALAKLDAEWAALLATQAGVNSSNEQVLRPPSGSLTEREAQELAAWIYGWWLGKHRENPSGQTFWPTEAFRRLWPQRLPPAKYGQVDLNPIFAVDAHDLNARKLEVWCLEEADDRLHLDGRNVDEVGHLNLAKAIAAQMQRASLAIERLSRGEPIASDVSFHEIHSHNQHSGRHDASGGEVCIKPMPFSELLDGWTAERKPAAKTLYEWKRVLRQLEAFVGHHDASRLKPKDLINWKADLIAKGQAAKTIRDAKLSPIRTIMTWGVDNGRLSENPAARVKMDLKKKAGDSRRGFTDDEAARLLQAAADETDPVRRWVPLICAYTGARVSEVCQLRTQDIIWVGRIAAMKFDAQAGSLKNINSERTIPLHSILVDAGFPEFVRTRIPGPLFPSLPPDKFGKQGGNGTKVLGNWIRKLGFVDPRLAPNHSWRHRFKTLARRYGLASDIVNAITGHGRLSVGDSYGIYELSAMKRELDKIPDQSVPQLPKFET